MLTTHLAKYEILYDIYVALKKCRDVECVNKLLKVLEDELSNLGNFNTC